MLGKETMTKRTTLMLASFTLACAAMLCVAQEQTNTATPGRREGARGFGGFGGFGARGGPPPAWIEQGYNDHQNMMDQLGIKSLRRGKSGNNQTGPGFEEATANEWMSTMPDAHIHSLAVASSKPGPV